jgi:hypothetical protein
MKAVANRVFSALFRKLSFNWRIQGGLVPALHIVARGIAQAAGGDICQHHARHHPRLQDDM